MKKTLKDFNLTLNCGWLMAAGVLLASSARADITYTQETRMAETQNAAAPVSVTVRTVSPNAERSEIRSFYGKLEVYLTTILLCEKNQEIQLDSGLKIYTVKSLNEKTPVHSDAPKTDHNKKTEKETGKIMTTHHVKDLGEEMVVGFKTHHYLVTVDLQTSGCAGDNNMTSKDEVWVSDIQDASPCTPKFDAAAAYSGMAQGDCKLTMEQKGDVEANSKIYSGIILRHKIYMDDKVFMTQETTSLSQAKVDAAVFAIPADYKKVTAEEFQTQQSAEMMKAMMAGDMPIGN